MKIALDITPAIRETAGVGRYTRELGAALLRRDDHTYTLLCLARERGPGSFPVEAFAGQRVVRLPLPERWVTIGWHRLRVPIPIDLLFGSHDLWHFPSFVVPPVRSGKVVLTVHDLSYRLLPETATPGLRRYLDRAVPRSIQRSHLVVADSQSTKQDVIRELNVSPSKVDVILSGVDGRFRPPHDGASVAELQRRLDLHFPFVLAVGTLQPRKNYERLIEAEALLARRGMPQHLVIAGKRGWLYDGIATHIDRLGIRDRVHILESVGEADLPVLYAAADLFVFPSLYEGFGIPPLEAMACGTPVVASNASSIPESVGDAGLLVDPYDAGAIARAIERVLSDDELRRTLRRQGIAHAAQFTWDAAAAKLVGLYERLACDGAKG